MRLSELLQRVTPALPGRDPEITFITDDSRKVRAGCVFVCIRGKNFDGHTAAAEAVEAGAAAVIAEYDTGIACQVLVPDTRAAYSLMCEAFFKNPAEKLHLIGITGTNGKTTSAFLIKEILDAAGYQTGLIGTVQNMVGDEVFPAQLTTPDPYELNELFDKMVKAGCTHCVMEVSSQALAQQRVAGMHFDIALFTNLTQDHLDYHGTFENYLAAKHKLFEQAGQAVINLDDPAAAAMTEGTSCEVATYSIDRDDADFTAKNVHDMPTYVEYELVGNGMIGRVHLEIPGHFSIYNSMGALLCAMKAGIPFQQALNALRAAKGVKGRIEVVPTGTDYTVIIDYAHSPDGLENILSSLREIARGRIICVFGCGGDRDRTKRPKMGAVVARLADVAVVTSDNPRSEDPDQIVQDVLEGMKDAAIPVHIEVNRTQAIRLAMHLAKKDDFVLLAGKGHETYQILKSGKIHYDEREIVAQILQEGNDEG